MDANKSSFVTFDEKDIFQHEMYEGEITVSLELITGIVGSVLALFLLIRSRHGHMWGDFYIYYTVLSLTDFLLFCLVLPPALHAYATDMKWNLFFSKGLCRFTSVFNTFGLLMTGFLVCMMSIERFRTVWRRLPNEHLQEIYIKRPIIVVSISVVICLVFSLVQLALELPEPYFPYSYCFFDYEYVASVTGAEAYALLYSIIGFILVLLTVTLNAVTLGRIIYRRDMRLALLDQHQSPGFLDWHTLVFTTIVILQFAGLWAPHAVFIFLTSTNLSKYSPETEITIFRMLVANDILNPWLYVILRRENLQFLISLWERCRLKMHRQRSEYQNLDDGDFSE